MAREVEVEVLSQSGAQGTGLPGRMAPVEVRPGCGLLFAMVVVAWGIEFADSVLHLFGFSLDVFGIFPRRVFGLLGVLFAPLLHGGWMHLMSNTVAFLGLGFAMSLAERDRFLRTTLYLVIFSGVGTWLIGRSGTVHIGASGLIYGYLGYLLSRAWAEKRALWMISGIVVAILYGSMLWGILPSEEGISWEGHLCGFLAGLWLGRSHGIANRGELRPSMHS